MGAAEVSAQTCDGIPVCPHACLCVRVRLQVFDFNLSVLAFLESRESLERNDSSNGVLCPGRCFVETKASAVLAARVTCL